MAALIQEYRINVVTDNKSIDKFYLMHYEASLLTTLATHAKEDEEEHGRLISIKDTKLETSDTPATSIRKT